MATKNIQWLRKLLEEAKGRRAHYDEVVRSIESAIAFAEEHNVESASSSTPVKQMRNKMWEILKDEGRPLHYKEIYRRLKATGTEVGGKDPVRNVGAHLSSDDRFVSLGSGKWGLVSWPSDDGTGQEKKHDEIVLPPRPSRRISKVHASGSPGLEPPRSSSHVSHHEPRGGSSEVDDFDDELLDDVPF